MQTITQGYIKLHRCLTNHWLWKEQPFNPAQAWVDLLLRASHTATTFPLGRQTVSVQRGQFISSPQKLADDWGWSRSAVRRFLDKLAHHQMVQVNGGKSYTTITIHHFDKWQGQGSDQENGQENDQLPDHNQESKENQEIQENQKNRERSPACAPQATQAHRQPATQANVPGTTAAPAKRKPDPYRNIGINLQDLSL